MAAEPLDQPAVLQARIEGLERERRRAFDDAQREADALFAQYQLSQLLASGGPPETLGVTLVLELLRLAGAAGGALWLGSGPDDELDRIAHAGEPDGGPPADALDLAVLHRWADAVPGGRLIVLGDEPPRAVVALWPAAAASLDEEGLRVVQLARHEIAVALANARLRQTLDRERHDLRAIVDGATDCIVQVDDDGRVVRLNAAGERLLGHSAGWAIGRPCADVLGCELAGGHLAADCPLARVIAGGDPIAYEETAVRGSSGSPVRVAGGYASSAGGADGARATAILRDISAVRALEELREGFVATVSHELRTPLALIRGYAETLLHLDLDAARQRAYVERIDEASARLTALVDQVLDVTHLQADPLILDRSRTTLAALVARLRGDLVVSGGADRLVATLPDDLPALDVDVVRVGQVLSNLVGNALKYAPSPTPVELGAVILAGSPGFVEVTVDDEGVGVPASDQALVTEPFHRAWNVRESRIPGTGLGLFICRRLVEAHGGALTVGDRPDGRAGTRVAFTLPVAPIAPERRG